MDRDEVRAILMGAITEIQQQSGRESPELTDDSRPFSDLEGFDSLNGEEVTAILMDDLDFDGRLNPFISEDGQELTIGEIVNRLAGAAKRKEKAL